MNIIPAIHELSCIFKRALRLVFVKSFFYFMEFILPTLKRNEHPSGIYKLVFDDLYFYIGSSTKLKNRATTWRVLLNGKTRIKNKNINEKSKEHVQTKSRESRLKKRQALEKIDSHTENKHIQAQCLERGSTRFQNAQEQRGHRYPNQNIRHAELNSNLTFERVM